LSSEKVVKKHSMISDILAWKCPDGHGDRKEAWEEAKEILTKINVVFDSLGLSISDREKLDSLISDYGQARWSQGKDDEQESQEWQTWP